MKGIVLSGGKSSRFGEDKALAVWNGVTLLERAVFKIRRLDLEPVVVTNCRRDYPFLDCRIERDVVEEQGPLGGLLTACGLFPDHSLLVLTCDMPVISDSTLKRLIDTHNRELHATVFATPGEGVLPFPGVYESGLGDLIRFRLRQEQHSMVDLIRALPKKTLITTNLDSEEFGNVNTKEELRSIHWPARSNQPNLASRTT
ncbi:MAG: molybdenum cofactor guanylyltransferase [Candidatus Omnitrophica bacterium]|nr:molybdenum cofactor guanylyltransferase [Candidatus Omnitrophota bacterium]